jgi:hypothetical protein
MFLISLMIINLSCDDAEFLHRLALEVEYGFERGIADQGTGDPPAFKVVAAALGTDLLQFRFHFPDCLLQYR